MADAFIYMFVVGSGASSGVAVVGLVTFKVFVYLQNRSTQKVSKRGKRGVV